MAEKMTRRTFMKSAAAAAAAISLSGVLVGCGGGLAQDEVQIGAFTAKVYNAKAFWVGGTGTNSSNYITATARLTLDTKTAPLFRSSIRACLWAPLVILH